MSSEKRDLDIALSLLHLRYGDNFEYDMNVGSENIAPTDEDQSNGDADEPMGLSPAQSSTDMSDGLQQETCDIPISSRTTTRVRKNKIADRKRRSNLPKIVVDRLSEWLDQNRYNAYPSEDTKQNMATSMGITVKQVNNWFINARRRKLDHLLSEEGKCACSYRITRKKKACPVNHQARITAMMGNSTATSATPSRPIQTPPTPCGTTSPSLYDSSTEESPYEFRPISPRERTLDFESL